MYTQKFPEAVLNIFRLPFPKLLEFHAHFCKTYLENKNVCYDLQIIFSRSCPKMKPQFAVLFEIEVDLFILYHKVVCESK